MDKGIYRLRNQRTRVIALIGAVGVGLFVGFAAMAGANPGGARLEVGFASGTSAKTIHAIESQYSLTEVAQRQAPTARLVTVSLATESLVLAELRANPAVVTAEPVTNTLK